LNGKIRRNEEEKAEEMNKVEMIGKRKWEELQEQLREKELKLAEVREEYRRFRKMLRAVDERNK
jgi:hypothetical protein